MYALWSVNMGEFVAYGDTLDEAYQNVPEGSKKDKFNVINVEGEMERDYKKWQEQRKRNPNGHLDLQKYADNHLKREKMSPVNSGFSRFY